MGEDPKRPPCILKLQVEFDEFQEVPEASDCGEGPCRMRDAAVVAGLWWWVEDAKQSHEDACFCHTGCAGCAWPSALGVGASDAFVSLMEDTSEGELSPTPFKGRLPFQALPTSGQEGASGSKVSVYKLKKHLFSSEA